MRTVKFAISTAAVGAVLAAGLTLPPAPPGAAADESSGSSTSDSDNTPLTVDKYNELTNKRDQDAKDSAAKQAAAAQNAANGYAVGEDLLTLTQKATAGSSNRAVQVVSLTLGNVVKGIQTGSKSGAVAGVVTFGFDELMSLLFPPGESVAQQIEQLSVEMATDFQDVQESLAELNANLSSVGNEVKASAGFAAGAACEVALTSADNKVNHLTTYLDNYANVFSPTWWDTNVASASSPQDAQKAIYNEVFTAGLSPDDLQNTVDELTRSLYSSSLGQSNSLVSLCADELSANAVSGLSGSTDEIVPVGYIEYQVFPALQKLVAGYSSYASVGQTVAAAMVQVEQGMNTSAGSVPQSCLDTPQAAACTRLNADIANTQRGVQKAFMLAGASWRQITNGAMGSDLRSDSTSGVTGGNAAWVMDIASYGTPGFFAPATTAVTSTSAASGPASGTTALRSDSWNGLTFTPATSAMWNSILRTQYQKLPNGSNAFPGDTSNSDCLPKQSSSQSSPNNECVSANSTGQLMAAAGLNNGSQDVGNNLIIYTGETDSWDLSNGAWYYGTPLQWRGDKWPSNLPVDSVTALSFLDSSMTPNNGSSVVVHDPSDYQGNLTTSSVFPFVLYNQQGQKNGVYNTTWQLTDNFASDATGTYYAQVACQTGSAASGAGNWYQGVSFPESAWTINRYTLGNDLSCGAYKYTPPSSPSSQNLARTPNSTFYESPELNLTGYVSTENFNDSNLSGTSNGVYYCNDGAFNTGYNSGTCPKLWSGAPGYFTGSSGQGSFTAQNQYLWPVVALPDPSKLSPLGSDANWLLPTQGSTGSLGLPAIDRQLFQDFLAVNTSISSGPISVQIPEGVKMKGQPDQASVLLANTARAATSVQVQFDISDGSFAGAPFSPDIEGDAYVAASGMVCSETTPGSAYSCSMTIPGNAVALVQLPVKLTGPASNGFTTGTLAVLGNGGTVSQDLGGKASGSFGGVYKLDTDLSQFDQEMLSEVAATDYGSVYDLRATLVDTPQNQIGKVQETTGLEASPFGVKLLGGYKPGSATGVSDVQYKVEGKLDSGDAKSAVTQSPACAGAGCFTVTGTVGSVSNGEADVNLTIQSGDPKASTVSVRAANDSTKFYASSNPTQVATGDVVKLKISDLPVGVHELTVWGTTVKSNFTVRVVPPNNSVAFTYVSPTSSPTIYLPEAGTWEFTMTPVVTIAQQERTQSDRLSSVRIEGKETNWQPNSNDDWIATAEITGDNTIRHTFWFKGVLDTSNQVLPWNGQLSFTRADGEDRNARLPGRYEGGGDGGGYTSSFYFDLSAADDLTYSLTVNVDAYAEDGSVDGYRLTSDAVVTIGEIATVTKQYDGNFSGDPVKVTLGPNKATAPAGLIATTDPTTGAITLSWQPVVVVPEVTSYVLTATPPDGGVPLRKSVPADVTETTVIPDALGEWTVTLTAVSELGKSPAATETVLVTSAVPPKPDMVDLTISPVGVVSGSWMSVASKPQVTGYHIGLYDPTGARVYEDDIAVTPRADQGIMRLPEFFGLGKNSQPGEWTFTVAAVNDDGRGLSRRGSLLITQAAIDRMERLVQQEKFLLTAETVELLALDRLECEQGLISGAMPTGTCDSGLFTPAPAFLGVLDDPGTSVIAQYCTGTATSRALKNCTIAEGAVVSGTVELLMTQSTLAAGGSAVLKVWESGKTVIWTSPAPVAQGATTLARFPAPSATTPYAITVGDATPSTGITTVVEVSVPSGSGSDAGSSGSGAAQSAPAPAPAGDVVVSSCSSAPCPMITGTRTGSTIVLTVTMANDGNGVSIFDTSTGAVVLDDPGLQLSAGVPVSLTLGGLRTGTNSMRMTVGSQRTSFAIR